MKIKNLEELLISNPKARDHERIVREALEVVSSIRKMGIQPNGYRLASPFERPHSKLGRRVVAGRLKDR
jgi:hypothetical protein